MRVIPSSRSAVAFWEDLTFLEAALLADEAARPLAPPVTGVIDEFMPTFQRDLDTRRTMLQASARNSIADAGIDFGLRNLFSDTLHLVKQDRKRPEFTTLFSTHIGAVVRHALKRQVEVARDLVDKLRLPLYSEEFRAPRIAELEPLIARGAQVVEEQRQAELTRVGGRIDVRTWKEEANAVRLSTYASLLALAAQNGRGKTWAEAFFKRKSAAGQGGEDVEEPEEGDPSAED